ncbi:MAG: 1-phosphofructokinase family hexose kinase [Thermoanaerobaculia bacterium]|nr:1-phosphofructokinase family hexose kinase [Thermoanaerobaculia bacterium]
MSKILTVTMSPSVDLQLAVEQVIPNRKLQCGESVRIPAGGGVSVARAVHRLGGDVLALFPSGGPTGERLAQLLDAAGVEVKIVPIERETRETVTVAERSSGNVFRFLPEGAALTEPEWHAVLDAVESCAAEYIVASGPLPPGVPDDFYGQLSTISARIGSRLIVDATGAALRHAAGAGTFLLKPNVAEARELAGGMPFGDYFLEGAARAIVSARKAHGLVLSMGAGGALLVTESGARRFPAPAVRVESRLGAGDSMVAGIVSALARGLTVDDAVLYGVAAGSAAVMNPGAELCRREDVERLYAVLQDGRERST